MKNWYIAKKEYMNDWGCESVPEMMSEWDAINVSSRWYKSLDEVSDQLIEVNSVWYAVISGETDTDYRYGSRVKDDAVNMLLDCLDPNALLAVVDRGTCLMTFSRSEILRRSAALKLYVALSINGDLVTEVDNLREAKEVIDDFESSDKEEDMFTPDYYEISTADHHTICGYSEGICTVYDDELYAMICG